jgi:DNA-binding FadR family transcriptional regulator
MGRRLVQEQVEHERRNAEFDRALQLHTVEETLDWLKARQLLESQAAALAALRASDEEIDELDRACHDLQRTFDLGQDPTLPGLNFHQILARACGSPLFMALVGSLYTPALVAVERALDVVLQANGTIVESVADHRHILDAVRRRDGRRAQRAMSDHIERLISEARRFEGRAAGAGLQDTVRLIQAARGNSRAD